jgi:flagellar hook assembly protein FlgD
VRFQYDITRAGEVKIDIYNFAMEKVTSIRTYETAPGADTYDRSATWDGRDNNGRMVDNGVYFFRANVIGKVSWGKIVVIN